MTTTAVAPTNIAVLKYWGKNPAFEDLLVPTKSSLSFTVEGLVTTTTVQAKKGSGKIDFELNGKKISPGMKEYEYVGDFLDKVGKFHPFVRKYDYRIASKNNFPTAAGFASSASGFAALIKAMAGELQEFASIKDDDKMLSALARLGSGSAARSIPAKGGFVEWKRGAAFPAGKGDSAEKAMAESCAKTLFPPGHWPDLAIIYVKVQEHEKKIKSRAGMKASIETNPLYGAWVDYEEGVMKERMVEALQRKDFASLAEMIMKASNSLHQICLGTYPPIVYLSEASLKIIEAVHKMNEGGIVAAYTFDAGPNAVVFCEGRNEEAVLAALEGVAGKGALHRTRMGQGARFVPDHLFRVF
ncbi:MAG TPA: diphosphomevalonate decarboxylase [Candidatus Bilamarchaeum sp.]|nr:diphosphomevalonate decarboxylase [Candidatus Bilamarchaeum sp.]